MEEVKWSLHPLAVLRQIFEDCCLVLHVHSGQVMLEQTLDIALLAKCLKCLGVFGDSKHH